MNDFHWFQNEFMFGYKIINYSPNANSPRKYLSIILHDNQSSVLLFQARPCRIVPQPDSAGAPHAGRGVSTCT